MKLLRVLFVISAACLTFYQTVTAEKNYAEPISEIQSEAKPTEVPMQFRGPMPAVEVMVNGKGPFLFAIDTGGAGMARVDISLGERLALKPTGKVMASDGSGINARELDTVALDSIRMGNIEFRNVTAIMRNYNQSPNLPKIDGILGFNLFADYLLTLDFPGKRVRVERGELPSADGAEILSFESPRGIPVIDLKVGDLIVKAHIDSGNTGEIVLPTSLAEKLPLAAEPVTVGRAKTVSNEFEIKQAPLNGTVHLGRFEIQKPLINFAEIFRHSNIGSRTLSAFSLTFDQKNNRVKLARTESVKSAPSNSGEMSSEFRLYTGRYGQRTISFENGSLYLQREGGPKLKMIPASGGEFSLEGIPAARIMFVKSDDAKSVELHVLNREGQLEISKKEMQ